MIEGGSAPFQRWRPRHTKARWDVVDIEVISIGKPMKILSKLAKGDPTFKRTYLCDFSTVSKKMDKKSIATHS